MPLLDELGIGVFIEVDHVKLTEYDDTIETENDGETTIVNKFVACETGKEFSIRLQLFPSFIWNQDMGGFSPTFYTYIDGVNVRNTLALDSSRKRDGSWCYYQEGKIEGKKGDGQTKLLKFKFSQLVVVEETNIREIQSDKELSKSTGLIEVQFWREEVLGTDCSQDIESEEGAKLTLAEKALKGKSVSHGTEFSAPTGTHHPIIYETRYLDSFPRAVFRFQYRSRKALQAELVIPRTPSPDPAQVVRAMSRAELERMVADHMRQQKEAIVKQERVAAIKRECSELVDLTDAAQHRSSKRARADNDREVIEIEDSP